MIDDREDLKRKRETGPRQCAHRQRIVWLQQDDMSTRNTQHFTQGFVRGPAMVQDFVNEDAIKRTIWQIDLFSVNRQKLHFDAQI